VRLVDWRSQVVALALEGGDPLEEGLGLLLLAGIAPAHERLEAPARPLVSAGRLVHGDTAVESGELAGLLGAHRRFFALAKSLGRDVPEPRESAAGLSLDEVVR